MLKREDLAKRFDEVVKQEIINHNKEIYNTNQAIGHLKDNILKIESFHDELRKKLINNIVAIHIKYDPIFDKIKKQMQSYESVQNDLSKAFLIYQEDQNEKNTRIAENLLAFCEISAQISEIKENIAKLREEMSYIENRLDYKIDRNQKLSNEGLSNAKNEILDRPCEATKVKEEITKRLKEKEVDVKGVLEEVRAYRSFAVIQEKKIENLYTLIDRIKHGG